MLVEGGGPLWLKVLVEGGGPPWLNVLGGGPPECFWFKRSKTSEEIKSKKRVHEAGARREQRIQLKSNLFRLDMNGSLVGWGVLPTQYLAVVGGKEAGHSAEGLCCLREAAGTKDKT